MSKQKQIQTFLTKDLSYEESMYKGIKYELVSVDENIESGFEFEECEQVFIEGHGNCYVFFDWYYLCEGYSWYRFKKADLILISN